MSKWVLSKEENVGQDFVELVLSQAKLSNGFLSQAKNVGLAFVARGNRQARFLSKMEIIEMGFVISEKCQTGFCRKGNRRTGLLSQEEIVKLGFVERKIVE